MSEKMLIATIVVGLAGLAIWLVLRPNKIEAEHEGQWPLATKHLLSEEQLRMFGELQLGLPGLLIMSGVALTRLLYVIPRGSVNDMVERSAYWVQRKNGKSVDFAICDHSSRLLAVVDLKTDRHQRTRDRDHQTEKGADADGCGRAVLESDALGVRQCD